MKNNAKTKISLVSILVILGVAARMMRVIHRQQIREQNRQTIQTTNKVAEFQKTLDEEETKKRRNGTKPSTRFIMNPLFGISLRIGKKPMNFMVWDKELGSFISITLKKKKRFS